MSNAPDDRYGFSNLTQSGLMKIVSKDDKNISLSINAFGGSTSFSIFTGSGGKPWSLSLKRRALNTIDILLEQMIQDPKPCRQQIMINSWDQEAKRSKQVGHLAFGIDENLVFQIDLAHEGLNGNRYVFPVKTDFSMDFSNTTLSEKDILKSAIMTLREALMTIAPIAERITSFKRPAGNFGGKSGGGGYNNSGGGNRGGGNNYSAANNNNRQSSTFGGGGGSDVSDGDVSF
jgi:hypothetical protein